MTGFNNEVPIWVIVVGAICVLNVLFFSVLAISIVKCRKAIISLSARVTEDTATKFSSLGALVEGLFRDQFKKHETICNALETSVLDKIEDGCDDVRKIDKDVETHIKDWGAILVKKLISQFEKQENDLNEFKLNVLDRIGAGLIALQKTHESVGTHIKHAESTLVLFREKIDTSDSNVKYSVDILRQHADRIVEIENRQQRIFEFAEKLFEDSTGVLSRHAGLLDHIEPSVDEMRRHEVLFVELVEKILKGNAMYLEQSSGVWQKTGEILETNRGIVELLKALMLDSMLSATAQTIKVEVPSEPKVSMPKKQANAVTSQSKRKRNVKTGSFSSTLRKMTKEIQRTINKTPLTVGRSSVAKPRKKRAR